MYVKPTNLAVQIGLQCCSFVLVPLLGVTLCHLLLSLNACCNTAYILSFGLMPCIAGFPKIHVTHWWDHPAEMSLPGFSSRADAVKMRPTATALHKKEAIDQQSEQIAHAYC